MKFLRNMILVLLICFLLSGCKETQNSITVATTTMPVYYFTAQLCSGTDIEVTRLITDNVSCLHDYTLRISQMQTVEKADHIVISGAGLEDFLNDAIHNKKNIIDASSGVSLLCSEADEGENHHDHDHHHTQDPHIWLSPENGQIMAHNIYTALVEAFPQYESQLSNNFTALDLKFENLIQYAHSHLTSLSCRELITFHDGFSYMADAWDLTILHAIEEESGSEASASELIDMIGIITQYQLPAIFTEVNGSGSAAGIISAETGIPVFSLDMAMSGEDYFDAIYHNIDTIKEALQ